MSLKLASVNQTCIELKDIVNGDTFYGDSFEN